MIKTKMAAKLRIISKKTKMIKTEMAAKIKNYFRKEKDD